MKASLLALLLCAPTFGQIVMLDEYNVGQAIEATIRQETIPEGAEVRMSWKIPETIDSRASESSGVFLWAPPGSYTIGLDQFFDWPETIEYLAPGPKTEDDPTGMKNPVVKTRRVYVKPSEFKQSTRAFKVLGKVEPEPDPDNPDPEPDPTSCAAIPPDIFGNAGMLVCQYSQGMAAADRAKLRAAYEATHQAMMQVPIKIVSLDDGIKFMRAQIQSAATPAVIEEWNKVLAKLPKQDMDRSRFARYCLAISKGL